MLLDELRQNIAELRGLGTSACASLKRLNILQISELLQHYPLRYLDHRKPSHFGHFEKLPDGVYLCCICRVVAHEYIPWRGKSGPRSRQKSNIQGALKIIVEDETGIQASLLCFGRNFLAAQLRIGSDILLAGKFQSRYAELQCANFVYEQLKNHQSKAPLKAILKAPLAKESGSYNASEFGAILPIYAATQGLNQKQLRSAVAQALQHFSFAIEDEIPAQLQCKHKLLNKKDALRQIHFPDSDELCEIAHRTLVYEELLLLMLRLQRRRLEQHRRLQTHPENQTQETPENLSYFRLPRFSPQGTTRPESEPKIQQNALLDQAKASLPFALSEGQNSALAEILHSFTLDIPMNRLLQGDVGSGKTIVALLSALPWLEAGAQVVLMAPTEILVRQLQRNFEQLRENLEQYWQENGEQHFFAAAQQTRETLGQSAVLTGSISAAQRKKLLGWLRSGDVRLLFGTHALFFQKVEFARLRYIIVDEQQRFGVTQRLALRNKAAMPPHVLLMSATPIPRTLALTFYGDLDISSIRTMPANRKAVKTHLVRRGNDAKMYHFIERELAAGHQAYFVYPLIASNSDTLQNSDALGNNDVARSRNKSNNRDDALRSVEQMAGQLGRVFADYRLGVVHGRLPQDEKNAVMDAFRSGEIQLLLATTVVEVGVDVPNASVMVIEHAERFGLAQLHQLRGRVGRGADQSYCFLVYEEGTAPNALQNTMGSLLNPLAKQRLLALKESNDGFAIAEKDLELRGPGDLLGAEQSGSMELRIAKIPEDLEWLQICQRDATQLLTEDYALLQASNQGLRRALGLTQTENLDA